MVWYSSALPRKKSGVLFISAFLPWGNGRAERKADTSRSGGCHLFRFQMHSIPRLTSDQLATMCSKPGPHLVNFPEAQVSLDSFNMLGCRQHGLF